MLNYLEEIAKIKVNKTVTVVSFHKPLLLLLTIADVINGHANNFAFKDIESQKLKENSNIFCDMTKAESSILNMDLQICISSS